MLRTVLLICATVSALPATARGQHRGEIPDTLPPGRMEKIDSLRAHVKRNSLGGKLADYLFVTGMNAEGVGRGTLKSEAPYIPYIGRFIRHVMIYRYNILSDTRVGTDNPDSPGLVRAVEWVHIDTKASKISAFLLFEEGDPVDPNALADTERLLRETAFIQDALVRIVPLDGCPDSVDVQVLTRDVWSIGLNARVITSDRYRLKLYEKNFLGYGHAIEWETSLDFSRERLADHTIFYGARNIYGTFIDGSIRVVDAVDYRSNSWGLSRSYVSPAIRWIGAVFIDGMDDPNENPLKARKWDRQDAWIGRSIKLGGGFTEGGSRRRIIPALRVTRTDYHVRPTVSADRNRSFHDRTVYLGSVSLTERSFRKLRMVFSYGQTEDIPYGFLYTVTGGGADAEFFRRSYAAIDLAYGGFYGSSGYLAARGAVGSYFRNGKSEDGTITLTLGGFSSLLPFWRSSARHFLVIDYIYGYHRTPEDDIALNGNRGGLRGLTRTGIEGKERLTLSWECVLFADWNWYGFRFASFAYAETGQAGPGWDSFMDSKYYWSLGLGFRVHNERLIFDAYEMRLMYYPEVPEGADTQWFKIEAVRNINIPYLSPGAPRVIKYE